MGPSNMGPLFKTWKIWVIAILVLYCKSSNMGRSNISWYFSYNFPKYAKVSIEYKNITSNIQQIFLSVIFISYSFNWIYWFVSLSIVSSNRNHPQCVSPQIYERTNEGKILNWWTVHILEFFCFYLIHLAAPPPVEQGYRGTHNPNPKEKH